MFVPDCLRTDSAIAGVPLRDRGGLGVLLGVDRSSATSRTRIGWSPCWRTTISPICVGLDRAALDAQRVVASGRVSMRPPGTLTLPRRDRALDLERGHAGRGEPDRIEVDVDLALLAAEDHDLADAGEALDALLDLLVGEPREVAHRRCPSGP